MKVDRKMPCIRIDHAPGFGDSGTYGMPEMKVYSCGPSGEYGYRYIPYCPSCGRGGISDYNSDYFALKGWNESVPATVAETLGVPVNRYARMTTEERHDFAYDVLRHCPALLDEFMGLPEEIEIPEELTDKADISEWLTCEFGFYHQGFELKEE